MRKFLHDNEKTHISRIVHDHHEEIDFQLLDKPQRRHDVLRMLRKELCRYKPEIKYGIIEYESLLENLECQTYKRLLSKKDK